MSLNVNNSIIIFIFIFNKLYKQIKLNITYPNPHEYFLVLQAHRLTSLTNCGYTTYLFFLSNLIENNISILNLKIALCTTHLSITFFLS